MLNSRTLDRRVILAGTAVLVWAVCAPMARSAGSPRAGASTWVFSGTATSAAAEPRCHFTFFLDEVDRVSQVEAIRTETDRKEPWRNSPRAVAQKSLAAIDSALASVELTEENSNSPVSERRFSLSTEQTRYDVTVVRPAATPGSGVDDESARWYVARILKLECPAGITVEEALAPDNRFFRVDLASGGADRAGAGNGGARTECGCACECDRMPGFCGFVFVEDALWKSHSQPKNETARGSAGGMGRDSGGRRAVWIHGGERDEPGERERAGGRSEPRAVRDDRRAKSGWVVVVFRGVFGGWTRQAAGSVLRRFSAGAVMPAEVTFRGRTGEREIAR